jgi:hypothetical protein
VSIHFKYLSIKDMTNCGSDLAPLKWVNLPPEMANCGENIGQTHLGFSENGRVPWRACTSF